MPQTRNTSHIDGHRDGRRGSVRLLWCGGALAAATLVALGALALDRPGYSPDEEITAVTVRGISRTGLPLLPSGVLYNRGLPFTYLAWASGRLFGDSLQSYRAVSLLAGAAGVVLAFRLALARASGAHALGFAFMLATFPPYVSASVFARPYSALAACALLALGLVGGAVEGRRTRWPFLAAVAVANALHPLGAVLAALPLVYARPGIDPGRMISLCAGAVAVTALTQAASYGLHWISLGTTATVVTARTAVYAVRAPAWPPSMLITSLATPFSWGVAVALFGAFALVAMRNRDRQDRGLLAVAAVLALLFQLGLFLLFAAIVVIVDPRRARRLGAGALALFGTSVAWWPAHLALVTDARYSAGLSYALSATAMSYPLEALRSIAVSHPPLAIVVLVGIALAVAAPDTAVSRLVRGVTVVALATLAAFQIGGVPPFERYLLLPSVLLLLVAAHGIAGGAARLKRSASSASLAGRLPGWAWAVGVTAWMAAGHYAYAQHRGDDDVRPSPLRQISPETGPWTPERFRPVAKLGEPLVCTEELACSYLLGGVDYVLAATPADIEHYVVTRGGRQRGFYADAPAITSASELASLVRRMPPGRCAVVVGLYTSKVGFAEYRAIVASLDPAFVSLGLLSDAQTFATRLCHP